MISSTTTGGARRQDVTPLPVPLDPTFETHYSIAELSKLWKISRETVRLLIKDEPGVCRIRLGRKKSMTRYSVPASVAIRIHTRLLHPVAA